MTDENKEIEAGQQATKELKSMLSSSNYVGVIETATKRSPGCKDKKTHIEFAKPVLDALRNCKKSTMNDIIGKLEEHEREIVLKYVYYGFQAQPEHSTEYLAWQQAIVKKDGLGVIVRVVSDIKRNILCVADPLGLND